MPVRLCKRQVKQSNQYCQTCCSTEQKKTDIPVDLASIRFLILDHKFSINVIQRKLHHSDFHLPTISGWYQFSLNNHITKHQNCHFVFKVEMNTRIRFVEDKFEHEGFHSTGKSSVTYNLNQQLLSCWKLCCKVIGDVTPRSNRVTLKARKKFSWEGNFLHKMI